MEQLIKLLEGIIPVSDDLQHVLLKNLTSCAFKKGHLLLKAGQVSDKIYFINSGLIRGYYIKDGRDITTGFMKELDFALSPISFFGRQEPFEYLELIEDSSLYALSRDNLNYLYDTFIEFNRVGRSLVEEYYVRSEIRTHFMRVNTAEEKYKIFLNNYSGILNRINNKDIASFIGITPETLSRIRAKR